MMRLNLRQRTTLPPPSSPSRSRHGFAQSTDTDFDDLEEVKYKTDRDIDEGYLYKNNYTKPEYDPFKELPMPMTTRNRYADNRKGFFSDLDSNSPKFLYTPPQVRIILVILMSLIAICLRFYSLSTPHEVVFDEVHFGGFSNRYLRGTYFFDVHPPLGKMMYAFVAYLAGYDGSFTFKSISLDYTNQNVPYVAMRMLPAMCGSLMVPLAYLSVSQMGFSIIGATLAALMVLFETSFITQTRFILLDGPLLIFICATVFSCIKHGNHRDRAFTKWWWIWLSATGFFLGCAISVKWVGLFTIAFIGLHTVGDLWIILGNQKLSLFQVYQHFMARVLCLICLPIFVYILCFYIHFSILPYSGPGNAFMSRDFRDGLMTAKTNDLQTAVHTGAQISLKNQHADAWLHSHNHLYSMAGSSFQQQVTGYAYKDHNNWFYIAHVTHEDHEGVEFDSIVDGDRVYLRHVASARGLYCHGFPAPVSKDVVGDRENEKQDEANDNDIQAQSMKDGQMFEISAFDGDGHVWEVVVIGSPKKAANGEMRKNYMKSNSKIKIRHAKYGCYLSFTKKTLPSWGFGQQEIVCKYNPQGLESILQLDEVTSLRMPAQNEYLPAKKDRSGFFTRLGDIFAIQKIAWDTNNRLTGKHAYQSRPQQWPILNRGISYWQKRDERRQVYLLGNPVNYWSILFCPPLYLLMSAWYAIRARRGIYDLDKERQRRFLMIAFLWLGYALHFVPFFFMQRQLFLHHYLPAHYLAILAFAGFCDHLINMIRSIRIRLVILTIFAAMIIYCFWYFAPLCYSNPKLARKVVKKMKWLKTWDIM